MRSDDLYLSDIVQAADSIARFVEGLDEDRFIGDDLVRSAVLHKLTVIGEAAARVSSKLKRSHPGSPWVDIVGFRNMPSMPIFPSIGDSSGTPQCPMHRC